MCTAYGRVLMVTSKESSFAQVFDLTILGKDVQSLCQGRGFRRELATCPVESKATFHWPLTSRPESVVSLSPRVTSTIFDSTDLIARLNPSDADSSDPCPVGFGDFCPHFLWEIEYDLFRKVKDRQPTPFGSHFEGTKHVN
jgi:hypothetical protein